jgi:CheY-like chemotaxis protein
MFHILKRLNLVFLVLTKFLFSIILLLLKKLRNIKILKGNMMKLKNELKILVVDDEILNLKIISGFLLEKNINFDVALNGCEALFLHKKNQYDIIFMDSQMPDMDGFTATRKIRRFDGNNRYTNIIATTSDNSMESVQKCFESGMNGFLFKPFRVDLFNKKIDELINKAS